MRKMFILDTSALIHDPQAFLSFTGSEVLIPVNVLDELDKLKTFPNEAGKNARVCIRYLDALCAKGAIHKGIKIENNITLRIDTTITPDTFGTSSYVDNKILACAYAFKLKNDKKKIPTATVLVSRDINLRIRARAHDIQAENYEKDKKPTNELYTGFVEIANSDIGEILYSKSIIDCASYPELEILFPNQCVHVVSKEGKGLALGKKIGDKVKLIQNRKPWGLESKSKEQAAAIDLICDKKIPLVSLVGKAGCGKTIVALAAALEMVVEKKEYSKLVIYRPMEPVGREIGFTPGTLQEKLSIWMSAIYDNLEVLFSLKSGNNWQRSFDYIMERGLIEMQAITHIRGRSISNTLILLDEAQNCSKEDMKTILTRSGKDSKFIITGDTQQIDNKNLDSMNNGLSYVVEKFKNSDLSGHITFSKSERSALAEAAADLL